MKYTDEQTQVIIDTYNECSSKGMERKYILEEILFALKESGKGDGSPIELPTERSLIAKLSSLGIYRKSPYLNKNGELPKKKEVYIEELAELLGVEAEELDSMVKVNKNVLELLIAKLK